MRHTRRTLLVLLTIFTVLLVLALAQGEQLARQVSPDAARTLRVYAALAEDQIAAVRLYSPADEQTFTLNRGPAGGWTAPDTPGTLDTQTAALIARTVAILPYERTIPLVADADLVEYGFNPNGRLLIQAVLDDGQAHAIAVGGLTPNGRSYYALVDERPEIYLVERGAIDYLIEQLRTPPVA